MKKIIAVLGATGAQGGGLVRSILNDPDSDFLARAVVRNPYSEQAIALTFLGVEVVKANFDDPESLKNAFAGAYGAFCVTNFGEVFSPEKEVSQAANMAEAAKAAGLKHVIWSTLEDARQLVSLDDEQVPTLMGKYKLPQADGKAEANKEFTSRNVPTTFMLTSFYWENFIQHRMGPAKGPDCSLTLTMPMGRSRLPGIATKDIGKCAYGVFTQGEKYIGKTVGIAGGHDTGEEIADGFGKVLGQEVNFYAMPVEDFRQLGFPGADIAANTFQLYRDFNDFYCGNRDLAESKILNPEIQSFDDWLQEHQEEIRAQQA